MPQPQTNLQLQSFITADALVHLELARRPVPTPGPNQVVVRVEAAPINPSDIGAMLGPANISALRVEGTGDDIHVTAPIPPQAMRTVVARIGPPVAAGIEGAGVVVAAGSAPHAQALIGTVVAVSAGGMYSRYRLVDVADVLVMNEETSPADAASAVVNPLTALGMVETLKAEHHTALVHTAAASNLGQMLNRLCLADGVGLVNVVRSPLQIQLLRGLGAEHVVDSTSPEFRQDLTEAVAATNATLCFDVIGGGPLVSQILTAMETAQAANVSGYARYGSDVHKQVYICGLLDPSPTELTHTFGLAWGVGGWLLRNFLDAAHPDVVARMRGRVAAEIMTTFRSSYTRTVSLREALEPEVIAAYHRRATGEKYLVAPQL